MLIVVSKQEGGLTTWCMELPSRSTPDIMSCTLLLFAMHRRLLTPMAHGSGMTWFGMHGLFKIQIYPPNHNMYSAVGGSVDIYFSTEPPTWLKFDSACDWK